MRKRFTAVGLGAILLSVSSLLSRFLGIGRDYVFAKVFGVGAGGGAFALDAYFAAFRIPDLMYTLLIFGAMSAAFIPIYTTLLKEARSEVSECKKASEFASHVLNGLLILLLVAAGLLYVFAPYLVPLIAPGFEAEVLATTVNLTRIMLISPIFLGLSSVFQGVENSHKKFLGIATAPIVYNLSIIVAAWFFGETYGVYALAWGVVCGAALHFLVQVPGALRTSFRYKPVLSLRTKPVRDFIKLTIPRLFGISVTQLGLFVDTIIASLLALGSISIFNYAMNLQSLPGGVVAVSLSVAVFSTLSEDAHADDKGAFLRTMARSTHAILFWVLPAVLGLFLLREEIVDLILRGGEFGADAAAMTALMLGIFVWAALGQSLIPIFARGFYALHETKRPVLIALAAVIVNIAVSLILTQVYDFEVWALAISAVCSATLNAVLLVVVLGRFMEVPITKFFNFANLLRVIFATVVMGACVLAMQLLSYPNLLVETAAAIAGGGAVYLLLAKFMKIIPSWRG